MRHFEGAYWGACADQRGGCPVWTSGGGLPEWIRSPVWISEEVARADYIVDGDDVPRVDNLCDECAPCG